MAPLVTRVPILYLPARSVLCVLSFGQYLVLQEDSWQETDRARDGMGGGRQPQMG